MCDEDDFGDFARDDTVAKRREETRRKEEREALEAHGRRHMKDPDIAALERRPPARVRRGATGRAVRMRRLASEKPARDAEMLRDVEEDLATDVALKRAFFASGRLAARILGWVESLSKDVDACARAEDAARTAFERRGGGDGGHWAAAEAARLVHAAQKALAVRAAAGLSAATARHAENPS